MRTPAEWTRNAKGPTALEAVLMAICWNVSPEMKVVGVEATKVALL